MPAFGFKIRTGKSLGGGKTTSKPVRGATVSQTSPVIDPRAAPPAQPAVIAAGVKTVNTEVVSVASGTTQGQTYNLPLMDVITVELYLTISAVTGSLAVTDFCNLIDHIQVADGQGGIFAKIPGGTFLYDNYTRYTTPPPTTLVSNVIASAATSGSALIVLPNIRIPAAAGGTTGCQLTVFYAAFLSAATVMTVTDRITVRFGNCGGYATRYQVQNLNLAAGDNLIQTNSTPQSNLISELFIRNIATTSANRAAYFNYVRIQTNGQVIEQQLFVNQIIQRDLERWYGAFALGTLVLGEPGQFAMNSTSEFDVNMVSAVNTVQFVWVFYVPAASA